MLNQIIKTALNHRLLVLAATALIIVYGALILKEMPIDVFPDLTRPTITLMTEAHGRSPEEVEVQITIPLENLLNGLPNLERIRSYSTLGLSVLYLEFSWDAQLMLSRQMVSERLLSSSSVLPNDVRPTMGAVTSLMGQIQQIALTSKEGKLSAQELRTLADWVIRPKILGVSGVAQVLPIGGEVKQYQIVLSPEKMKEFRVSLEEVDQALEKISENATAGLMTQAKETIAIRTIGRVQDIEELKKSFIKENFGVPVTLEDIAEVQIGHKIKLGDAGYNGQDAVVLSIQKQPEADTVDITEEIEKVINDIRPSLPEDLVIDTDVFRQSHFIKRSIDGVMEKLFSGSALVFVILLIFLANLRMSSITMTAIPVSFCVTFIILSVFGLSVNTMTLGGLAIAIGELVDDSIVDVENIYRRLTLEAQKPKEQRAGILKTIYLASSEVRNSIVLSTIIIALVFYPLFHLSGLEGRLLMPLGIAYLTALVSSLIVSLTLTPVLSYYLFKSNWENLREKKTPPILALLQKWEAKLLHYTLDAPKTVISVTAALTVLTVFFVKDMGRDFLPPFNEGTAMLAAFKDPTLSLEESSRIGREIEKQLMSVDGVHSVSRKTGRSEEDEHIMPSSISEIDINFDKDVADPTPILQNIRDLMEERGDIEINIGQPLSHLMDHMLSGVSAQMAIKIFGHDLAELRAHAAKAFESLSEVEGIEDLRIEPQQLVKEVKIYILREEASKNYVSVGELTEQLEGLLYGKERAKIIEDGRIVELISLIEPKVRSDINTLNELNLKTLPNAQVVTLYDVADVYEAQTPNEIHRENNQRRIMLSANSYGVDLGSLTAKIRDVLDQNLEFKTGQYYKIEGQFEAQQSAQRKIALYSFISFILLIGLLLISFKSTLFTFQILISLPLSMIGGALLLYFMEGTLTVASMVGFIALAGIASRNAIMLISHYLHLMEFEGEGFTKEMIIRGTNERLAPVLMTALTAIFALIPLLFAKGTAGSEILYPVAVVLIGGLVSSTFLDVIVTPSLFYQFAKNATNKYLNQEQKEIL